jgi:hypothetical protein
MRGRRARFATLTDKAYHAAGIGIRTPVKQAPGHHPLHGRPLAVDHRAYNTLHAGLRCLGERAVIRSGQFAPVQQQGPNAADRLDNQIVDGDAKALLISTMSGKDPRATPCGLGRSGRTAMSCWPTAHPGERGEPLRRAGQPGRCAQGSRTAYAPARPGSWPGRPAAGGPSRVRAPVSVRFRSCRCRVSGVGESLKTAESNGGGHSVGEAVVHLVCTAQRSSAKPLITQISHSGRSRAKRCDMIRAIRVCGVVSSRATEVRRKCEFGSKRGSSNPHRAAQIQRHPQHSAGHGEWPSTAARRPRRTVPDQTVAR